MGPIWGAAIALPLALVPSVLSAQVIVEDSAPSVAVPSLPASPPVDKMLSDAGAEAACPPPAGSFIAGRPAEVPFVPFMLGDFIGPLANPMTDIKVADGESPIPLDRVFYRFNMYSNLDPSRYQNVALPYKRVNVYGNVFGFEKTFGDSFSFGFRIPFNTIQALSRGTYYRRLPNGSVVARVAPPTYESTIFGNINGIFKVRLYEDTSAGILVSSGLSITFPTATNASINPGPSTAAVFQPFLGYLWSRERFYVQGFSSMTLPVVSVQSIIWFNDVGIGMWAYRNDSQSAFLSGIAPTFEMHLNVPLQGADRVSYLFNRAGLLPFYTQLNLTFGGTFEFYRRATLGLGFVVPTVGPNPFQCEFQAQLNVRF